MEIRILRSLGILRIEMRLNLYLLTKEEKNVICLKIYVLFFFNCGDCWGGWGVCCWGRVWILLKFVVRGKNFFWK